MKWAIALLVAGCSSGASPPAHPIGPIAPGVDAGIIASAPVSEHECDELFEHVLALGVAEQRAAKSPELVATDDDRAHIRTQLHDEQGAACRAMPRDDYRCALAAPTLETLGACQARRSSSTSNSSVAPGGILPPAAPVAP